MPQTVMYVQVLHTLTLNCSTAVRNQVAGPKLFPRLEKQLAKPQAPQVASAILQVFVDWAYLYGWVVRYSTRPCWTFGARLLVQRSW